MTNAKDMLLIHKVRRDYGVAKMHKCYGICYGIFSYFSARYRHIHIII